MLRIKLPAYLYIHIFNLVLNPQQKTDSQKNQTVIIRISIVLGYKIETKKKTTAYHTGPW